MTFLCFVIAGVLAGFVPLPEMSMFHSYVVTDGPSSVLVPNAVAVVIQTAPPILTIDAAKDAKGNYYTRMRVGAHLILPAARAKDSVFGYVPVFATGYVNRRVPGTYLVYYLARNVMGGLQTSTMLRVIVEE